MVRTSNPKWFLLIVLVGTLFLPELAHAFGAGANRNSNRTDLPAAQQRETDLQTAHELALEILQGENGCSAWFRETEPDSAGIFESLRFQVVDERPTHIVMARSARGEWMYKQPWAARTHQLAGRNATVDLNPKGAFFLANMRVLREGPRGAVISLEGFHALTIGGFPGDTLDAQITTLLHELAHVVGRVPEDTDSMDGRSGKNTEAVLRYCKTEIRSRTRTARESK